MATHPKKKIEKYFQDVIDGISFIFPALQLFYLSQGHYLE